MRRKLHIAIVEDEAVSAELLRSAIGEVAHSVSVYHTAQAALDRIEEQRLPDIILMDINLPDISGADLTYILKERYPQIEIIIQTVNEDTTMIMRAIEAGASGYILKGSPVSDILHAIEMVRSGGSFLTPTIARKVLNSFHKKLDKTSIIEQCQLTEREEEILRCLTDDLSDKEMAEKYSISPHTVNNHLRKIYKKLQVNSRIEARLKMRDRG